MMHTPRWKKLMFAASLAVLPACGMEESKIPEGKQLDPNAPTEELGQTRAALTSGPASCQDIKNANPSAADGQYVLFVGGDRSKPWTAWCRDMAGTPAEYLSLSSTGPSLNFSQYTAGYNNGGGTNVRTLFTKVRIDPATLRVSTGDQTFSTSSGYLTHPYNTPVSSMAYAAAMNCDFNAPGLGNVDLRGTPFAAAPGEFVAVGYYGSGGATYSSDNQVVDLWNYGECGWMSVQGADHPFNGRGAQLQLQYRQSTPASCQDIKTALPSATDGEYVLYVNGDASKPWEAWCHDMAGTPAEYLALPSTGPSLNFSQYTAGYNNGGGTNVRTLFTKVRIDPATLRVSTGDQTFSTSTGLLWHGDAVTSMSYAAAMNCDFVAPGLGNVDLRNTPFAVAPGEFVAVGYYGSGGATYSSNNQVVDLWNYGECGWMSVQGADHPFNGRGAQLQLQYAPPPASPPAQPTSGSFNYNASNTNSATQNTSPFDVTLTAGQTLSFGTCGVNGASGSGDTFLRLYAPDGSHVAANDDACGGLLSFVGFTATQAGTYRIQAGCYSSGGCNGTVAFTIQ